MASTIDPNAYYHCTEIMTDFGLTARAIGLACSRGELRSFQLKRRRLFRGAWLLDWLADLNAATGRNSTKNPPPAATR